MGLRSVREQRIFAKLFGRCGGGGSAGDGVTIKVKATYEVRSPQRIQLIFQEAGIGDLRISGGLEGLLAPALLPRTWLQQRLLLALREVPSSLPLPPQPSFSCCLSPYCMIDLFVS